MKGLFPVAHGRCNVLTLVLVTDAGFFTLSILSVLRDEPIKYPENLRKIQNSHLQHQFTFSFGWP